jgi:hypothetical protein
MELQVHPYPTFLGVGQNANALGMGPVGIYVKVWKFGSREFLGTAQVS